jgi:hypothetical protein
MQKRESRQSSVFSLQKRKKKVYSEIKLAVGNDLIGQLPTANDAVCLSAHPTQPRGLIEVTELALKLFEKSHNAPWIEV